MDRHMTQALDRYITGNWGEDQFPGDEHDPRHTRLAMSARHLTGAEMERLLHRYDLPETAATILTQHEAEESWWMFETYSEQLSERGHATRHYSRQEAYHRAHPLYGPVAPPAPVREWDDDEVPF
jgi:hypothetical protein